MHTVTTDHARHSTSLEVASRLAMGATLQAGDAAAIASWYQSPAGHGAVLAQFASGRPTSRGELLEAVLRELVSAPDDQRAELSALVTWVREH